jgi:hypothetical protein
MRRSAEVPLHRQDFKRARNAARIFPPDRLKRKLLAARNAIQLQTRGRVRETFFLNANDDFLLHFYT